jgi:proline dehydrogenase
VFRQLFSKLATSRRVRHWAERSPLGLRLSSRFVAGIRLEDAIAAVQATNARGMAASMDQLGENVTNAEEARRTAQSYQEILQAIHRDHLNSNISIKLTHLGLDVDANLARELVCDLVRRAALLNNFIRVDMEGSAYTQRTLDLVRELHRAGGNHDAIGTVIQAYLYRSERDVEQLCSEGIRIRLCKGAYLEPASIAYQKKADVDANYIRLMKILLKSGIYHGIATHDARIIEETLCFAGKEKIPRDAFEFQMLYGVRRDLQQQIVREGWRMRIYIPFGREWYPYFMRRLAERPANVLFLAKNLLRG